MENLVTPKFSIPSRNRPAKKPDKPLYMPRVARERLSLQNSEGTMAYTEMSSPASGSGFSSSSDNSFYHEPTDTTNMSSTSRPESHLSVTESVHNNTTDSSACYSQDERKELVPRLHEAEPFVWDETVSCFSELTLEDNEKDEEYLAAGRCSAQTEDMGTGTADVSEEVCKAGDVLFILLIM